MLSESDIEAVIGTFNRLRVKWAVIGAHAVGIMSEPRATADFDFVVEGSAIPKLVAALEDHFGDLDVIDIGAGVRLRAIDVDLVASTAHALFRQAIAHPQRIGGWNVASREVMIALKFMATVSPWRGRRERAQDIVDLQALYETAQELDRQKMIGMAAQVYPGAENEFAALLDKIDHGDPIEI